jgi:hypothetical protein
MAKPTVAKAPSRIPHDVQQDDSIKLTKERITAKLHGDVRAVRS